MVHMKSICFGWMQFFTLSRVEQLPFGARLITYAESERFIGVANAGNSVRIDI
jgi:hypothetical protein